MRDLLNVRYRGWTIRFYIINVLSFLGGMWLGSLVPKQITHGTMPVGVLLGILAWTSIACVSVIVTGEKCETDELAVPTPVSHRFTRNLIVTLSIGCAITYSLIAFSPLVKPLIVFPLLLLMSVGTAVIFLGKQGIHELMDEVRALENESEMEQNRFMLDVFDAVHGRKR